MNLRGVLALGLFAAGCGGGGEPVCGDGEADPAQLCYAPAVALAVGARPGAALLADFDSDGAPDLAVTGRGDGSVSLLLGRGGAAFDAAREISGGGLAQPFGLAAADFDSDGALDLAATDAGPDGAAGADAAAVLFGDDRGGFAAPLVLAAGEFPEALAAADLDGDGDPDLAAVNAFSPNGQTLSVFLNDQGGFTALAPAGGGAAPAALALGDINGDGSLDIVTAEDAVGRAGVILNDGLGNFAQIASVPVGLAPRAVALGDIDSDGDLDIVTADLGDDTVSVLVNGGGFAFTRAVVPAGVKPHAVALADFNGDGDLDLAVANEEDGEVTLHLGAAGAFGAGEAFAVGDAPVALAVADLNGDDLPDLVTANQGDDTASVLLSAP